MQIPPRSLPVFAIAVLLALGPPITEPSGDEAHPLDPGASAGPPLAPNPHSGPTEVFLSFASDPDLADPEKEHLSILHRQQPTDIRIAQIRTRVGDPASLLLDLGDGDPEVFLREGGEVTTEGSFTWFGDTPDKAGSVILAVHREYVHGVVYDGNRTVRIAPLGGSSHAMWQVVETGTDLGECLIEPEALRLQEPSQSTPSLRKTPTRARASRTTLGSPNDFIADAVDIRLLAVYSDLAASLTPDIVGHIEFLVAWANASYVNSRIEATGRGLAPHLTLAAAVPVELWESSGDNSYFLWRFANRDDAQLGFIHDVRDSLEADVCVLLTGSDNPESEGVALGGPPRPATAFCMIETGYSLVHPYVFAHEVGHLQNAQHSDGAPAWAPFYARGYCHEEAVQPEHRFWTIMCILAANKIPYWSNPNVTYEAAPGARFPTGDVEHNNARVLGETALVVASHRGKQVTPVEVADLEAVGSGDRVELRWRLSDEALEHLLGIEVRRAASMEGPYAVRTPVPLVPASRMTFEDTEILPGRTYWYSLVLLADDGAAVPAGPLAATAASRKTELLSCSESPDDGAVRLSYAVGPETTNIRLQICDVRGRIVRSLDHGRRPSGQYSEVWDRRDRTGGRVVRGVYMVQLNAGPVKSVRRVVLVHD